MTNIKIIFKIIKIFRLRVKNNEHTELQALWF